MPLAGQATAEGTAAYRERFPAAARAGHFRQMQGLWMSSVGIGTYLGEPDEATDQAYTAAVTRALELGANVIDTAINYRLQRSERSIGAALAALTAQGRVRREEVVVCTKAGFLTPDGEMPGNPGHYFQENYLQPGICTAQDIAAGVHCMTPRYLDDQLDRSLRNLGLECIDVFYLHNPETQLSAVPRQEFLRRLRLAFELLEHKVEEGKIQWYGTATWSGYRQPPGSRDYLSLEEAALAAREVAGEQHHLRFLQLPFNLAMPEAFVAHNQTLGGRASNLLDAARELGNYGGGQRQPAAGQPGRRAAGDRRRGFGWARERRGAGPAVCPLRPGRWGGAGGHEKRGARGRKPSHGRGPAGPAGAIPQAVRGQELNH